MQIRHGDLLIEKIDKFTDKLKERKDKIVERGEATGHAHRITGNGLVLEYPTGETLIKSLDNTVQIVHEEHKPIEIPKGIYKVTRQREYDAFEKASRTILD